MKIIIFYFTLLILGLLYSNIVFGQFEIKDKKEQKSIPTKTQQAAHKKSNVKQKPKTTIQKRTLHSVKSIMELKKPVNKQNNLSEKNVKSVKRDDVIVKDTLTKKSPTIINAKSETKSVQKTVDSIARNTLANTPQKQSTIKDKQGNKSVSVKNDSIIKSANTNPDQSNVNRTVNLTKLSLSNSKPLVKQKRGPEYALMGLIIPGSGTAFVTRNTNKAGRLRLLVTVLLTGASIAAAIQSNNEYKLYKTSPMQTSIYNTANNLNKASIMTGAAAVGLNIVDIITAIKIGKRNKHLRQ